MKVRHLEVESIVGLMKFLEGKIFHVTSADNVPKIHKSNSLLPNTNCKWISPFGNTQNGFFRLKGCVSFFDYRKYGSEKWLEHYHKCTPEQALDRAKTIAIYILHEGEYLNLISWEKWKEEIDLSQRVVPHIEIGFQGAVSLEYISELIVVKRVGS